jgi:hypothetical protein
MDSHLDIAAAFRGYHRRNRVYTWDATLWTLIVKH